MAVLMKRGNEALDLGDIASARLLFQRAAAGGNAAAAVAIGKTYDRNFTPSAGAQDFGARFRVVCKGGCAWGSERRRSSATACGPLSA